MRQIYFAAAAALAASAIPALAQSPWIKSTRQNDNSCSRADLNLRLTPYYKGVEINLEAEAVQFLVPPEDDVGIQLRYAQGSSAPRISSVDLWLPNEGLYSDGTVGARLSVDDKVVKSTIPEAPEVRGGIALVQWSASDIKAAGDALSQGKTAQVQFLDAKREVLRTSHFDLSMVHQAMNAIKAARWVC